MIGQERLLNKLNNYNELPKFLIFEGMKGCGKRTLANELANKFDLNFVDIGLKMNDILSMIDLAKETTGNLFFINNGNNLSLNCENTLLKITEELPNDNFIILSVENKELLLPTIISRGEVFKFDDYTNEDFQNYCRLMNIEIKKAFDYTLIYPNLSLVGTLSNSQEEKLLENISNLLNFDKNNLKRVFKIFDNLKNYDLTQILYIYIKFAYAKMLTSSGYYNRIIMKSLRYIEEVKRMMNESQVYNQGYIIDSLALKLGRLSYGS